MHKYKNQRSWKKIPDDARYITTNEFNKFAGEIFDERLN